MPPAVHVVAIVVCVLKFNQLRGRLLAAVRVVQQRAFRTKHLKTLQLRGVFLFKKFLQLIFGHDFGGPILASIQTGSMSRNDSVPSLVIQPRIRVGATQLKLVLVNIVIAIRLVVVALGIDRTRFGFEYKILIPACVHVDLMIRLDGIGMKRALNAWQLVARRVAALIYQILLIERKQQIARVRLVVVQVNLIVVVVEMKRFVDVHVVGLGDMVEAASRLLAIFIRVIRVGRLSVVVGTILQIVVHAGRVNN